MKRIILAAVALLMMVTLSWAGTVAPTAPITPLNSLGLTRTITWAHLTASNASGDAVDVSMFRALEVQIKGTWNTGTLTIQGSDDGTNYLGLRSLSSLAAISQTADPTVLIPILETPNYVKPVLAGAGTDDVTVTVTGRN